MFRTLEVVGGWFVGPVATLPPHCLLVGGVTGVQGGAGGGDFAFRAGDATHLVVQGP